MLTYDKTSKLFNYSGDIVNNDIAKRAGFQYDRKNRRWITPFPDVAQKVGSIKEIYTAKKAFNQKRINSMVSESNSNHPKPEGLEYRGYQIAGIDFLLDTPRALLADDMGLGKTIQCIGACNVLQPKNVLIICPASLKTNWRREWDKWTTYNVSRLEILNYDILKKHHIELRCLTWDMLILDEAHYIKNKKAQRTQEVYGGYRTIDKRKTLVRPIQAKRVIAVTGTPIENRPIEIYATLKYLAPEAFNDWFRFSKRYCGMVKTRFGYDYKGSSNSAELQAKLRSTIMIRRLKKDVLTELPEKVRQIVELDPDKKQARLLKKQADILEQILKGKNLTELNENEFMEVINELSFEGGVAFEEMALLRKEIALSKIVMAIEHINAVLETGQKVIVFAHHTDVINAIQDNFSNISVKLTGSCSMKARQNAVDRFQNDPSIKVFIGNIQAAGVGITLTAASNVIFVELSLVPSTMVQAEDRAHRIGQRDTVMVKYLVLADSLDVGTAKMLVSKQRVIDAAMNDELAALLQ